jgi:hypothetical protein
MLKAEKFLGWPQVFRLSSSAGRFDTPAEDLGIEAIKRNPAHHAHGIILSIKQYG